LPPGATREQVALGDRIFHGEASEGTCSGCHGTDAGGTSVGPPLNNGIWVHQPKHLVSHLMPVTVVEFLEMIDIDREDAQRSPFSMATICAERRN
jgi:hypothetical protein